MLTENAYLCIPVRAGRCLLAAFACHCPLLQARKFCAGLTDFEMSRIKEEQQVVEQMIRLYCRKKEGNRELCPACAELLQYAKARLEHCKFGENKTTCRKCPVHCYRPEMKERIRKVMRWSGPRMIWYHPVAAIRHLVRER